MYTQCPECSTVFRLGADTLRAAQGRVRCGICSAVFNALEDLSEVPAPRAGEGRLGEDTMTVEELPGTEFIELSGVTEAETEATAPPVPADGTPGAGPGAETSDVVQPEGAAQEPGDGLDAIPDTALEFHGSPDDLERLFVEAGPQPERTPVPLDTVTGDELERAIDEVAAGDFWGIEVEESEQPWRAGPDEGEGDSHPGRIAAVLAFPGSAARVTAAGPDAVPDGEAAGADLDNTDEFPILVLDETEAAADDEAAAGAGQDDEAAAGAGEGDEAAAGSAGSPAEEGPQQDDVLPPLLIPEQLRRDAALTAAEELAAPAGFEEAGQPRRWPLAVATGLLALLLGVQAVHHWREPLSRNPVTGPWLLRGYSAMGLDVPAPVDLSAFELRQLGAATEPTQAGRIKVRASIVNRAPFAQPFPILRLALQDRFGSTIGARDLRPVEYLPGGEESASGLLGPAERADAEVVFVDPGRDAVGFELDVCFAEGARLRCSADPPPAQP